VLEQGCSLEAGMVQVSGLTATYAPSRPAGARVLDVRVGGAPLELERRYRVTTNSFLAEGGDGYAAFVGSRVLARDAVLSDLVLEHVRRAGTVTPPPPGRLVAR
jgi:5'-nucleotidase